MKKLYTIFLVFLLSICLFLSLSSPVLADDKDDQLTITQYQLAVEKETRLQMQLALIQQQFKDRSQELKDTTALKETLEKMVKEIEAKKKAIPPVTPGSQPEVKTPIK